MPCPDLSRATAALRRHYGFRAFRPAQARVVRAVLAGGDVLAVLPTGSGTDGRLAGARPLPESRYLIAG